MSTEAVTAPPMFRLAAGEFAVLVEIADTPPASRTAEFLKLNTMEDPDGAKRYGLSSLAARGLVTFDGDVVRTVGEATSLVRAIQVADQWLEIGLVSGDVAEGALVVGGEFGTIFIGANLLETYDVVAFDPNVPSGENTARIALAFLDATSPSAAALSLHDADGVVDRVAVKHVAEDIWEVASGAFSDDGKLPLVGNDRALAQSLIVDLWGLV